MDTPAPASPATEQGVDNGRGEPSQGSDLPRSSPANALAIGGQRVASDQGLYAILGLDPSVSDDEIQTTYRRQAAKLLGDGSDDVQALKQLNVA
ncbi:MAG TPA: J domain-containing protein, partial [Chloroflexota bacterium]|nr:J domain-containing protein [Chloroflexota bacterium]